MTSLRLIMQHWGDMFAYVPDSCLRTPPSRPAYLAGRYIKTRIESDATWLETTHEKSLSCRYDFWSEDWDLTRRLTRWANTTEGLARCQHHVRRQDNLANVICQDNLTDVITSIFHLHFHIYLLRILTSELGRGVTPEARLTRVCFSCRDISPSTTEGIGKAFPEAGEQDFTSRV
ncbi:hypothetical protein Tco_0414348 [Tanacetum coccineum]